MLNFSYYSFRKRNLWYKVNSPDSEILLKFSKYFAISLKLNSLESRKIKNPPPIPGSFTPIELAEIASLSNSIGEVNRNEHPKSTLSNNGHSFEKAIRDVVNERGSDI